MYFTADANGERKPALAEGCAAAPLATGAVVGWSRRPALEVHGAVAKHYGADPTRPGRTRPRWTTWSPPVADRDPRRRGTPAGDGRLQADAVGEVELDSKVLVVKRVHVT
jgi:hypothetical protein